MRKQITKDDINQAIDVVIKKMFERLDEKGYGALRSRHEILGVVAEEFYELINAVTYDGLTRVSDELLDIAVACILGIACIDSKSVDW